MMHQTPVTLLTSHPLLLNPTILHLLSPQQPPNTRTRTQASPDDPKDATGREKFGLSAIVSLASNQGGFDLTTLGLNLNAPHAIWRTLVSPFSVDETSQLKVARHDFTTPPTFAGLDFRPSPEQLRSAPIDALFFAFLAAPQDALQSAAADELRLRGWSWSQNRWVNREGQILDPAEWTGALGGSVANK